MVYRKQLILGNELNINEFFNKLNIEYNYVYLTLNIVQI
jgi:hypothetical protein